MPEDLREQVKKIAWYNKLESFYDNYKYKTKQFGEVDFLVRPGADYGSAEVNYENQRIEIFIPDIWTHTGKITPCLDIIDKYFEINKIAKNAILSNYKKTKVIKEYFKNNFKEMDKEERMEVFSTGKYNKIDFPRIIEKLSYPGLHISLSEDNKELQVSLSYVLAKDSFLLRGDLLEVTLDENLSVLGFEHALVFLD